jgi:hypothetical protein
MKAKAITSMILGLFVVACGVMIIAKSLPQGGTPAQAATNAADSAKAPAHHIIAYYFHNNVRCPSCHKIENYSREAITKNFAKELEDGLLEFKMVNLDEEGNGHFVQDYGLYTKHLILVEQKNGKQVRYADLVQVWDLLGDQDKFSKYVVDNVRCYINGKPCPEDHEDEPADGKSKGKK